MRRCSSHNRQTRARTHTHTRTILLPIQAPKICKVSFIYQLIAMRPELSNTAYEITSAFT